MGKITAMISNQNRWRKMKRRSKSEFKKKSQKSISPSVVLRSWQDRNVYIIIIIIIMTVNVEVTETATRVYS